MENYTEFEEMFCPLTRMECKEECAWAIYRNGTEPACAIASLALDLPILGGNHAD